MKLATRQNIRLAGTVALAIFALFAFLIAVRALSLSPTAHTESIHSTSGLDYPLPSQGALHGAITDLERIDEFECLVGKDLAVIKIYQHFHDGDFYRDLADLIRNRGAIEFLSLDPVISETVTVTCDGQLEVVSRTLHPYEITSGAYDGVITQFASHIKEWGYSLILSFAGEMNGCWCPPVNWQGCYNEPNGPDEYIQMYRHVHKIFKDIGANNVTWAWVLNHESIPNEAWNQFDNYYPGDEYVDIISVDGYNWGDDGPGGWKTFDQIFGTTLTSLSSSHYPTKPLMIGEFASVEGTEPISKAHWITDAYSRIKSEWPQIKAVVWYNLPGEWSLPVVSSPESIRAYRQAIADPHFIGDPVWCNYLPHVCKSYSPTSFCMGNGSGGTEIIPVEPPRTAEAISIELIKRRAFPGGEQYGFSLWEVEIYGPGTGNLAIGATATASSAQGGPGCPAYSPYKAIDDNMNTRWSSDWSEPQWLTITLPARQVVDRIVLKWETAYAQEYCVNVTR